MTSRTLTGMAMGLALVAGCGDSDGSTTASASGTDSAGTMSSTDGTSTDSPTTDDASATGTGTMGSNTSPDSSGTSATDSATDSTSATDSGTDTGTDSVGTGTTAGSDETGTTGDTETSGTSGGVQPCQGGGEVESFLWAANSSQGTISKIDTETVMEVGRYIVRPDSAGSPSRTSVSLSGNVAVANRSGGITKIYANPDDCQDTNGQVGIQTSNNNVALPWGTEECVAWYAPFNYQSQRPVAWVQGTLNEQTCQYENEMVWTSGTNGGQPEVLLLDGDTGVVIDQVVVQGLVADYYGIYGGAVDGDGNFWGTQLGTNNRLIRVSIQDLSHEVYVPPNGPWWYGMTVDSDGYPWMCGDTVARFDPVAETFQTNYVNGYTGCMAATGQDGLLWVSGFNSVIGINRQTLQVEKTWPVPGAYGVSIDFNGFVWTVEYGDSAHRVDPDDGTVTSYNGLVGAYTYSDMTGYALSNAGIID